MRYQGLSLHQRKVKSTYFRRLFILPVSIALLIIFCIYHRSHSLTNAAGPPGCLTVSASGPVWQNLAFVSAQSGTFIAEMNATPLGSGIDGGVGLSNGVQTAFTGLACIA